MKNTVLFMVMGIIYALSSEMDYLDAEMMRRNGRDMIATTLSLWTVTLLSGLRLTMKNESPLT